MTWEDFFDELETHAWFSRLIDKVEALYEEEFVIPEKKDIFKAFELTPFDKVKVVIIAQDPYPESKHATGLAFSVHPVCKVPASLKNIYREIESDLGIDMGIRNGDLTHWAEQGVFLLNRTLTTIEGSSNAHKNFPSKIVNWRRVTSAVVSELNNDDSPKVFLIWGKNAEEVEDLITNKNHLVLKGAHPSPYVAFRNGFFGKKYFSKTNDFLVKNGLTPIKW